MSLLGALISDVNSKQVAKRALFSGLPFEIGPDFKISVKGYNLLQEQKPSRTKYVWLGGEKALLATGVSGKVADAIPVEKTEIKKAYKFGGTHVLFTPEEIKDLKKFESPVLRVIGFKPQSMLPFWASIKKSTFIYPSEEHYVGSTRVFVAFWKKLLKDKIMGLAWYIARSNASPILVAIIPSPERLDDKTKIPAMPAGLWLYPLPFADDIRHPPTVPKPLVASDTLINDMLPIVQQLQLPKAIYDPNKYPNPALQWHFTVLQALALDDELPEKADDKTVPKAKQIDKRAGEYIHKWGITLDEESQSLRTKRVSEEPAGPVKKRVKVEGSSLESMSHKELKSLVVSGGLGKYTIPQLKALLTANGLSVSGKKPELAERIEQWVEDH
jgi:ATP-dependent DNA helicase 2 subunit 1